MMRWCAAMLWGLVAFGVAGCDSAGSVHPVGRVSDRDLAATMDGVWVQAEAEPKRSIHLRYLGDGDLAVAGVEWEDDEAAFKLQSFKARLLEDDGVLYFNVRPMDVEPKDEPTDEDRLYHFARLAVMEDGGLQLAGPNVPAFAAAVEAGTLDGTVKRGEHTTEVVIRSDAATLNAFIDPAKADAQFDMDKAQTLKRITTPDR